MPKEISSDAFDWEDFARADALFPQVTDPIELTDEQWRSQLDEMAYKVLRHEGTERAGTSALNDEHRRGLFVCAGCDLPLFTSAMKFDSGTGWPSFYTTIANAFKTSRDFRMIWPRTEYHCARCGGHHGHVFEDGPEPTGLRYCNNGVALRFIAQEMK